MEEKKKNAQKAYQEYVDQVTPKTQLSEKFTICFYFRRADLCDWTRFAEFSLSIWCAP